MAKISIFFIVLSSRPHRVYPQVVRWNEDILHLTRRIVNEITIIPRHLCIFYKTNAQQSVFHRPKTDKLRIKRGRGAAFFSFRLPFGSQPSAFSSADSATGSADFKRPSKREVLSLHRRNLREIHLIYCLDRKTPKKRLPLRGRGACRPRCRRQASGTPKVWHGAAVTEGVRQARPLSEFAQNFEFAHLLFFVLIFGRFAFVKFNFERLPS